MIDMIILSNHDLLWPVICTGILLFILFVWKEWSTPLHASFYLHILIALLSLISLAMLFLKPMVWNTVKNANAVLLTKGYKKEQLDSLKRQHKDLKVISYNENKPIGGVLDSISQLFIIGYGIRDFDFWQVENLPTKYLRSTIPRGIIKLNYNNQLSVGGQLVLAGRYNRLAKGHSLVLTDPGGSKIDSVLLDTNKLSEFKLATGLKVKGKYVYNIFEKDATGKSISSEPLPIQVHNREKLKIVMINGFPTFESKYLKNFLAETGNEVTVRSQLTKGKFKFEYFNTVRRPFHSFSSKQLESVDLLIIDANSYLSLSKRAVKAIHEAMQQFGIGVLILPDEGFFRLRNKIPYFEFLQDKNSKVNFKKLSLSKYPYVFKNSAPLEVVHRLDKSILAAYRRNGRGRVGTTVIQNSYQTLLKGNAEGYESFWTKIMNGLSRRKESSSVISSDLQFAIKDEPFSFKVRAIDENAQILGDYGYIPLRQHIDIPKLWSGVTYPKVKGWNSLRLKNDTIAMHDFYVLDSTNWKSITAYETIEANKRRFGLATDGKQNKEIVTPINQIWFFLIAVLGMGYLWFAPKLLKN